MSEHGVGAAGGSFLRRQGGYTLVEISIVLVIIGVLLAGILNAQSVLRNARTKDVMRAVMDFSAASRQFRDRYGAWPGDLATAVTSIPGLTCANGNGNGQVDTAAESTCATEMLIRTGMLRGDATAPILIGGSVTVSMTNPANSGIAGLPASWLNVIRVQGTDCEMAILLDRALDDGNTATGVFRTGTVCAGENESIQVPNAVLHIN